MKNKFIFFLFSFLISGKIFSQDVVYPFSSSFTIGFGGAYGTVNTWQEPEQLQHGLTPGIRGVMAFKVSDFFSVEAAASCFIPHNASPTFVNIHSLVEEINGNIMLPLEDETTYFRMILGGAHLDWKGTYSGVGHPGLAPFYPGELFRYKFFEGNIGMGFTQEIGDNFFLDGCLIMRVSDEQKRFGLTDTSLQLGFRYCFSYTKKKKSDEVLNENADDKKPKTESGIPGGKYKWMKKRRR